MSALISLFWYICSDEFLQPPNLYFRSTDSELLLYQRKAVFSNEYYVIVALTKKNRVNVYWDADKMIVKGDAMNLTVG
jgi:hypothetical protein